MRRKDPLSDGEGLGAAPTQGFLEIGKTSDGRTKDGDCALGILRREAEGVVDVFCFLSFRCLS